MHFVHFLKVYAIISMYWNCWLMLVQSCDKAKPGYNVIIDLPEKAKMFILLFGDIKGTHFQSLRLVGYFNGLAFPLFR